MIQKIISRLKELHSLFPDFEKGADIQIEKKFPRVESDVFLLLAKHKQNTLHLYVKIVKEETFSAGTLQKRLSSEYACLQSTYEYFKNSPMHRAVRPIAFFPEWHTIVTAESPGLVLKPVIMSYTRILSLRDIKRLQKAVFLCGRWLRDFHHCVKAETEFELEGITLYVSRRLEILEDLGLIRKDLGKILRKNLEEIEKGYIRFIPSVLLHNDFIPGNILIDGEKVCVLDFSWAGRGCHYFDITAFWLELQRLGEMPHHSRSKVSLLQKSFLEGYGEVRQESVEFRCFELLQRVNALNYLWIERQKRGYPRRLSRDFEIKNQLRWLHQFKAQI